MVGDKKVEAAFFTIGQAQVTVQLQGIIGIALASGCNGTDTAFPKGDEFNSKRAGGSAAGNDLD